MATLFEQQHDRLTGFCDPIYETFLVPNVVIKTKELHEEYKHYFHRSPRSALEKYYWGIYYSSELPKKQAILDPLKLKKLGRNYLIQASSEGFFPAKHILGLLYFFGNGVKEDGKKSS